MKRLFPVVALVILVGCAIYAQSTGGRIGKFERFNPAQFSQNQEVIGIGSGAAFTNLVLVTPVITFTNGSSPIFTNAIDGNQFTYDTKLHAKSGIILTNLDARDAAGDIGSVQVGNRAVSGLNGTAVGAAANVGAGATHGAAFGATSIVSANHNNSSAFNDGITTAAHQMRMGTSLDDLNVPGTLTITNTTPTTMAAFNGSRQVSSSTPDASQFVFDANGLHHISGSKSTNASLTGTTLLPAVGDKLSIKEGGGSYTSNASMGANALSAGTMTIASTTVTANTRIFLSVAAKGSNPLGIPYISAQTAGVSFTVTSTAATDNAIIAWLLVEPGP